MAFCSSQKKIWRPPKFGRVAAAFILATSILLSDSAGAKEVKAPDFLEPIANETVPSGRDVRLACVVDHLGSYKLAWIQRDRSAILTVGKHVITRNPRIGVMHDEHRTWYLLIRNVKPGDAGTYMCQINTEPVTSQIGVVNVVVPPYIKDDMTSNDVRLQEGASVNLACSSRGSPIPTVKWKREDAKAIRINSTTHLVEEVSGPILHLTQVSRSDMGAYLCIASNGVPPSVSKRIQVQVKFRPTVEAPHQLVGVIIGHSAELECKVESWPLGLNYWKRPKGFEILHTDEKYNVTTVEMSEPYQTRMFLTIRNFSVDDIGDYNCISNNSQGGAEQVIRVSASPTISSNPNLIDKGITYAKETPKANGKGGLLNSVLWGKDSSHDEKNDIFNKKKDKSTNVKSQTKPSVREEQFFDKNSLEEAQQHSSAAKTEPWGGMESFGLTVGIIAYLFSQISETEDIAPERCCRRDMDIGVNPVKIRGIGCCRYVDDIPSVPISEVAKLSSDLFPKLFSTVWNEWRHQFLQSFGNESRRQVAERSSKQVKFNRNFTSRCNEVQKPLSKHWIQRLKIAFSILFWCLAFRYLINLMTWKV